MPSHPKVWLQPVGGVSTEASQAINRSIPGDQQKHPRRSTEASQARRVLDSPCGGLLGQVQLQQRQGTTAWRQQGSSTQAGPSLMGFTRQQAGPPGKGFKPKVKLTNQASMHHGIMASWHQQHAICQHTQKVSTVCTTWCTWSCTAAVRTTTNTPAWSRHSLGALEQAPR
jgi:hypothetical protein